MTPLERIERRLPQLQDIVDAGGAPAAICIAEVLLALAEIAQHQNTIVHEIPKPAEVRA